MKITKDLTKNGLTLQHKMWNLVKVPRLKGTTKGRTLSWDLKEGSLRSKSSMEMLQLWEARSQIF